ncbi:hypothetical protein ACFC06_18580 [Nocardia sp. NPDC056064]|uniref:hypothetical protein n=1 Tax=Nocardia sp. NPDC056064 TaxID=3345701 RepID=UPI0035D7AA28
MSVLFAGIGALLGGAYGLLSVFAGVSGLVREPYYLSVSIKDAEFRARMELEADIAELWNVVELATGAVLVVLAGIGGILLLRRQAAGLPMVIMGNGLAFFAWVGIAAASGGNGLIAIAVMAALVSLAVLIMAVLPSTQRWIDDGRNSPNGPNRARSAVAPYN